MKLREKEGRHVVAIGKLKKRGQCIRKGSKGECSGIKIKLDRRQRGIKSK
jgi:hypothetical protein